MKFIDTKCEIIVAQLKRRLKAVQEAKKKLQWMDSKFSDFDGTTYRMSTPSKDALSAVQVSIALPYFDDLEKFKCSKYLQSVYGDLSQDAELDYNFTVLVDLKSVKDENDPVIAKIANLKRNAFAAICHHFFDESDEGKETKKAGKVDITQHDTLYVCAKKDRVLFFFGIGIKSDPIITNMFLQEMVDIRKKAALNAAPQVSLFVDKTPPELKGNCKHEGPFFTFHLYSRHFQGDKARDNAIDLLANFRTYLNYHIKCAKAHIHTRMRKKTEAFKKVMARANFREVKAGGKKKKGGKPAKKGKASGKKKAPPKGKRKSPPRPPKRG